jgi:ankyrin repeat protein
MLAGLGTPGQGSGAPAADGSTPLIASAFLGRVDMFRLLLRLGADPSRRDKDGKTALDHAAAPGQTTPK